MKLILSVFILIINPAFLFSASAGETGRAVILQGFHWESHMTKPWWDVLASKARDIAESGFDMVWVPPSGVAASDEGYLPTKWYQQDSQYGAKDRLISAVSALHNCGVKVIADVILNHRLGSSDWGDFTDPQWGPDAVCSDDEWSGARGAKDTGKGYHAARDIDHTKIYVQESIKEWMSWLKKTIGYDGWRYDYVLGYAPQYLAMYNDASTPYFAVGEIWEDLDINNPNSHRQRLCNWLDANAGRITLFDFTTKGMLQHAVGSNEYWRLRDYAGKPIGLIGWWPSRAVTFVDNHDTGPSTNGPGQNHWPFPKDKVMQGYAYILTHPGIPCVYWPHFYDWGLGGEIKKLIKIRKEAGITSTSPITISVADSYKYCAIIAGRVAVEIGGGRWALGSDWELAASGQGYAVWVNKTARRK